MIDVVVSIPDKEYLFFRKLVKSLDFAIIKEPLEKPTSGKQFLDDLREAARDVNDIKAGKKKGQPLKDFLDEL